MEQFYLNNSKYIVACDKCNEIVKFNINYENFTLSVKCKNGHYKKNISFKNFEKIYIKQSQIYKSICFNCFNEINDYCFNYKCEICNKLYCRNCITKHIKKTNHNSKSLFIHQYLICRKHKDK